MVIFVFVRSVSDVETPKISSRKGFANMETTILNLGRHCRHHYQMAPGFQVLVFLIQKFNVFFVVQHKNLTIIFTHLSEAKKQLSMKKLPIVVCFHLKVKFIIHVM